MAVGDFESIVADTVSVADAAYMTIQPAATKGLEIDSIVWAGAVELYKYDGTNSCLFDSDSAAGSDSRVYKLTNADYLRVKNVSGGTIIMSYSGIQIALA